jgi:hypothetical protein
MRKISFSFLSVRTADLCETNADRRMEQNCDRDHNQLLLAGALHPQAPVQAELLRLQDGEGRRGGEVGRQKRTGGPVGAAGHQGAALHAAQVNAVRSLKEKGIFKFFILCLQN